MRLVTRQSKANMVADVWHGRYSNYCGRGWMSERFKDVWGKIAALGATPTPSDVDELIGNRSWTDIRCDNCEDLVDSAVMFEGMASGEYGESCLCVVCVEGMSRLLP